MNNKKITMTVTELEYYALKDAKAKGETWREFFFKAMKKDNPYSMYEVEE